MSLIVTLTKLLASLPLDQQITSDQTGVTKTVQQLIDELNAKGDADSIAAFLEQGGYCGSIGDDSSCPIANYLSQVTGKDVSVDSEHITVTNTGGPIDGDVSIDTPPHILEFINAFDNGEYPELEEDYEDEDDFDDDDEDDYDDDYEDEDDYEDDEDELDEDEEETK